MTPITRKEKYLAKLGGEDVTVPDPITREEMYLAKACDHSEETIANATDEWLSENIDPESGYALDRTLTLQNAAAPADLVGAIGEPITTAQIKALFE